MIFLAGRALLAMKSVYEWFSFANEGLSLAGVAKRTLAATAVVGGFGGAAVGAVGAVQTHQHNKVITQAVARQAPDATPEIIAALKQIKGKNLYSAEFLGQTENRATLDAIVAVCREGNALPADQCDIAGPVLNRVQEYERYLEARRRMEERDRQFMDGLGASLNKLLPN